VALLGIESHYETALYMWANVGRGLILSMRNCLDDCGFIGGYHVSDRLPCPHHHHHHHQRRDELKEGKLFWLKLMRHMNLNQ